MDRAIRHARTHTVERKGDFKEDRLHLLQMDLGLNISSKMLKTYRVLPVIITNGLYIVVVSCTPLSFFPQPRCRGVSLVLGPHQHYLRMLQNRIPACKTDKTCNVKNFCIKKIFNILFL